MKPEQRFDAHVQRGCQVVAIADMPEFVSEDGIELLRGQVVRDSFRQQQHRAKDAEDAGLHHRGRFKGLHGKRQCPPCRPSRGELNSPPSPEQRNSRNSAPVSHITAIASGHWNVA